MSYVEIPTHLPDYVRSLISRPPLPPPTAALDTACRTAAALERARATWSSTVAATEDATAEQLRSVDAFLHTAAGMDSHLGHTLGDAR
ncbi:hypothetical protein [Corynebacterium tuberculostearicum]|uniref:hypothetical protein n=1 Tax=Corynebacterium tuberculostearicum TaxID=38304 RepID=UPI0015CEDF5C|nr:hypothetical protein [Corynebacterium tuberculostearicum]NYI56371.1 hypothetical protein [Corynebacterium tuberculostearicum]QQU82563.1 hypothetical protein I6I74_04105 [Corynebacterium tuberculostearicum]